MSETILLRLADCIEAAVKSQFRDVTKMETTTPTCEKSSQVGDRMLDLLNRVHDFLGKLCRDGRCDDHCSECIDASDLADDVWDLIQSCKEPSQVGNAAAMYEALEKLLHGEYKDRCEVTQIAHAALSATPRNVDRFNTLHEVIAYWREHGDEIDMPLLHWLFAEAKGEAKCR